MFLQDEQVVKRAQKCEQMFSFKYTYCFNGNVSTLIYGDVYQNFFCGHQPTFRITRQVLARQPNMLRVASNRGRSQQNGPTYFKLRRNVIKLSSAAPRTPFLNKSAFIELDCLDLPRCCLHFHLGMVSDKGKEPEMSF